MQMGWQVGTQHLCCPHKTGVLLLSGHRILLRESVSVRVRLRVRVSVRVRMHAFSASIVQRAQNGASGFRPGGL